MKIAVGGFAGAVALFALLSWSAVKLLRPLVNEQTAPRWMVLATRQLSARPAYAVVQVSSLAVGLLALVLLVLLRTDLVDSWRAATPADAPNRFVINVMPDQADAFRAALQGAGVSQLDWYPMFRGRLVAINGRAGARDFPYDEHSCFGVSLACAMARQSEARRLGGLDLSLSDMLATAIDLSARVREAGRDVHYFGSLQGTRHGNGPDETSERALSELAERHGPMLAAWRSRSLRLSRAPIWLMGPQGVRHRLRDRLADLLRRLLGPTHRHVRQAARGLMVRVDAARAPRGPRASTRPTLARRVGDVDRQGPGRRV